MHFGGNEQLVQALVAHRVEFLVIGGLAMSWYCPDRQADDMDLLVNPTAENSERLYAALSSLNLNGFSPTSFSIVGVQAPLKEKMSFYAELLTPKKDGPSFQESSNGAVPGKLFGLPVSIAGLTSLIKLKEHAVEKHEADPNGLPEKHRRDLAQLRSLNAHAV